MGVYCMNYGLSLFFLLIFYCFATDAKAVARPTYWSDNPKAVPHAVHHKSIKYRPYFEASPHPYYYAFHNFNQGRKQAFQSEGEDLKYEKNQKSKRPSSTRSRLATSPITTEEYYSYKKVKNESDRPWHPLEESNESPFQDLLSQALPNEEPFLDSEQAEDCEDLHSIDGFIHEIEDPDAALEESKSFNDLNLAFEFEKEEQKRQYKNPTNNLTPGKRDILCTEDPIANAHSGNLTFTALINCKAYAYVIAKITNNFESQEEIIQYIQDYFAADSESGFIYESQGAWVRISKNDASKKIRKILDACYTNIFAAIEVAKQNRFQ